MISSLNSWNQQLHNSGIRDLEQAVRLIASLAGNDISDDDVESILPALIESLASSPDPDRALNNLVRWFEAVPNRAMHFRSLCAHPAAMRIFVTVCGTSQLFSDILIKHPEYIELLANPRMRRGTSSVAEFYRSISRELDHIKHNDLKPEILRRFKQREFLSIGVRDILGIDDMPTTAREFSDLAEASVQKVLEIAYQPLQEKFGSEPPPFIVVGMGKFGGRELNYSSDIDLMFVCGSPGDRAFGKVTGLEYAHRIAERLLKILTDVTASGHLFRVDMRLRPEGRFGPLVRTMASHAEYLDSWAEAWERQALIKARVVAGDPELAADFDELIQKFVYRPHVTTSFLEDIRQNKERIEQKAHLDGHTATNVKVGRGGIRDIEFIAQLHQLMAGGLNPGLRTRNTLEALWRLHRHGLITASECADLTDDYQFLRTVEHRLQLLYAFQTQSLPTDALERELFARRMNYSSANDFDADYAFRTDRVRRHFDQLFVHYDKRQNVTDSRIQLLLSMLPEEQLSQELVKELAQGGFVEPKVAGLRLQTLVWGNQYGGMTPGTRAAALVQSSELVRSCTATGDPDVALLGIESLASVTPNPEALYSMFGDNAGLCGKLCTLAAGAPRSFQRLCRHQEWLDRLAGEWEMSDEPDEPQIVQEYLDRTNSVGAVSSAWDRLALLIQRDRLMASAKDLWGSLDVVQTCDQLTLISQSAIAAALQVSIRSTIQRYPESHEALNSIAVFGLGKLGGVEVGYGSDLDVVLVHGAAFSNEHSPALNHCAEQLLGASSALQSRDAKCEIDARLRPEGRVGILVQSSNDYRSYFLNRAATWERQTMTRARWVCGSMETGQAFRDIIDEIVYELEWSEQQSSELCNMKRRIETERLSPNQRHDDMKLGLGGLIDIEFLAQKMQLSYGNQHPELKSSRTMDIIRAASRIGLLTQAEAASLEQGWTLLTRLRNRVWLLTETSSDVIPSDLRRQRCLAIHMGFGHTGPKTPEEQMQEARIETMLGVRRIFEHRFYGERSG